MTDATNIHQSVRDAYAKVATSKTSCGCGCGSKPDASQAMPEAELGLSCGNPLAFGHLRPGMTVVDLGSGAGKDVFAAAMVVGASGQAIGVDMTDEMLTLARRNALTFAGRTGLTNVDFRKGFIEQLPVDDASADMVISNCVINLSPDKPRVFREVHRVLKPGGAMVVSDIVLLRPLPEALRSNEELYSCCIAGALLRDDYVAAIRSAGFATVDVLSERGYRSTKVNGDPFTASLSEQLMSVAMSLTVMAKKAEA